jgi:hypothetical protein
MLYYTRICWCCNNAVEITQEDMLDSNPMVFCASCHKPMFMSLTVHFTAMLTAVIAAMHAMQLADRAMSYLLESSTDFVVFCVLFTLKWSAVIATLILTFLAIKYLCYYLYCNLRKNI